MLSPKLRITTYVYIKKQLLNNYEQKTCIPGMYVSENHIFVTELAVYSCDDIVTVIIAIPG